VNYLLLVLIGGTFAFELSLGGSLELWVGIWGFVPDRLDRALLDGLISPLAKEAVTMVSAQFIHAGWLHLLGNVVYLRVFGDNVEDRLGHALFAVFFLAAGCVGCLSQFAIDPSSTVPIVGVSGAIAGVLGAYIVFFPTTKVVTLFPIFIFLTFIEAPAVLFIGIWGLQQFLNSFFLVTGETNTVAWFAHIGGFLFGAVTAWILRLRTGTKRRKR
jgi:membrane associated rhomboid family serine protease